jgi:hypothetical protein
VKKKTVGETQRRNIAQTSHLYSIKDIRAFISSITWPGFLLSVLVAFKALLFKEKINGKLPYKLSFVNSRSRLLYKNFKIVRLSNHERTFNELYRIEERFCFRSRMFLFPFDNVSVSIREFQRNHFQALLQKLKLKIQGF